MKNIYERAKAFSANEDNKQRVGAASKELSKANQLQPSRLTAELGSLPASSFLASASISHARSLHSEKHVVPVEHILVHKEIKKIFTFCQSGRVTTLRYLFQLLQNADLAFEDCNSK